MTTQNPTAAMIEAKHLADRLASLHKDLAEMRKEVRESLNQRVTHAEIGAFTQLMDLRIASVERLVAELEKDFKEATARTEADYKERTARIEKAHNEDIDGRKKLIYLLVAAVLAAVGTIIVQAITG